MLRPVKTILFLVAPFLPAAAAAGSEAYTVPNSEARISWELSLADGTRISITARDGEMARLTTGPAGGVVLGIVPGLADQEPESVTFLIFEVRQVAAAGEALREVEKFMLRPAAEYWTGTAPRLGFKLKTVEPAPRPRDSAAGAAPAVPAPETLIAWEVSNLATGNVVKIVARNGELARLTDNASGRTIGFTPALDKSGSVVFHVFEISRPQGTDESLKQIEEFSLRVGAEHGTAFDPQLSVKLIDIRGKS